MLSSVLRSKREIMRAFVRLVSNPMNDLNPSTALRTGSAKRLNDWNDWNGIRYVETKYDAQFKVVFDAIRQLMTPPEPKKRKIGFLVRERAARYGKA